MALTTRAVAGQFVFTAFAFACLAYCFYRNDFSVLYVAQNSNSELPTFYRVAAVGGAHEGSLLLWLLVQSIWTVAVVAFSRNMPNTMTSRVLGVLGLISSGFALFILTTFNPFERLWPAAPDGRDLNPLLQDHSLAVTEKRGLFKSWTLLLAITAFSLSLLGTFLVRSGVLESVHAFTSDPARGRFILIFLCVCIGCL